MSLYAGWGVNNTSTSRIKDAVLTSFCHKLFLKKGRTYNPDGAEFRKVYRECGYKNLKRQDLEKWVHSIFRIYFDCINAPCDEVYLNNFVDHLGQMIQICPEDLVRLATKNPRWY
jgi:hypothetical protein